MNIRNLANYLIVDHVPFTFNDWLKPGEHGVGQSLQVDAGSHLAPVRKGMVGPILTELVCLCSMWINTTAFCTKVKCLPKFGICLVLGLFECSLRCDECAVLLEQITHCKCQFSTTDRGKFNM